MVYYEVEVFITVKKCGIADFIDLGEVKNYILFVIMLESYLLTLRNKV